MDEERSAGSAVRREHEDLSVAEDVETTAQGLPQPLKSRFAGAPGGEGADFHRTYPEARPFGSWISPAGSSSAGRRWKLQGEYEKPDEEWDSVFAAHDEDQGYGFALLCYEGD